MCVSYICLPHLNSKTYVHVRGRIVLMLVHANVLDVALPASQYRFLLIAFHWLATPVINAFSESSKRFLFIMLAEILPTMAEKYTSGLGKAIEKRNIL